jgi:pimeloyl-ACP methyl ester carboxylesterase
VNQLSIQVSILAELAAAIKSGNYTGSGGPPKSLVLVGHSFGSAVTSSVVMNFPKLADGLILTGWSFLTSDTSFFMLKEPSQVLITT